LSSITNANYAMALGMEHRYPEAISEFRKIIERDPDFGPAHLKAMHVYAATGGFAQAVTELQKHTHAPGSFKPEPQSLVKLALTQQPPEEWFTLVAACHAVGGNKEKAFEYLEKAYAARNLELGLGVRQPTFDSLHSDPRWKNLLERMNLSE